MVTFFEWLNFDKDLIVSAVRRFLPHVEVLGVELVGSSALEPDERHKHDIEKHGRMMEDRDLDILVRVRNATPNDIEKWAFSDQTQELEDLYNYDVQLSAELGHKF